MTKKSIKLLLVGMSKSEAGKKFLRGLETSAAPEKPAGVVFEAYYTHTFEWMAENAARYPDLDLVCVADEHGDLGFAEVQSGFEKLAPALAEHPNHPAVDLLDRRMLPHPDHDPFLRHEVLVIPDNPKQFWQFVAERWALKNKPVELTTL